MEKSVSNNSYFSTLRIEASSFLLYSWLCITSEWRNRLWGITTAPSTLMIMSMLPWGNEGVTHPCTATGQSILTRKSS